MSGLREQVLQVLLSQGPWVQRRALQHLTACPPALDDVLADLVVEGVVEFKAATGYRCRFTPLVRRARLRLLQDEGLRCHMAALEQATDQGPRLVAGLAMRLPDAAGGGVVSFDVVLPPAGSPQALLHQGTALLDSFREAWSHG